MAVNDPVSWGDVAPAFIWPHRFGALPPSDHQCALRAAQRFTAFNPVSAPNVIGKRLPAREMPRG
jgi:hypothetical protein